MGTQVSLLLLFFFFFFFYYYYYYYYYYYRLYNPGWVLVCSTILFHSSLSSAFPLQPVIFILFRSFSTWSIHLNLGLPAGLSLYGVQVSPYNCKIWDCLMKCGVFLHPPRHHCHNFYHCRHFPLIDTMAVVIVFHLQLQNLRSSVLGVKSDSSILYLQLPHYLALSVCESWQSVPHCCDSVQFILMLLHLHCT